MIGIHTPKRTTIFYKWLRGQGILVSHDSWKNDATDSFEYKGLKIMLPNSWEEWYTFNVFFDRYYGTEDSENRLFFDNVRELKDWLEEFDPEDLFKTPQLLPVKVQTILENYNAFSSGRTEACEWLAEELEAYNLTFDGLYTAPCNLRFKND